MNTEHVESRSVGALPLLRQLSRDIGLVEVIDQLVQWDPTRCRLSPGQRIEALVLNILAGRSPLYRVAEFYEDTATDLVFGPGIAAEHLTDDCLARALDKLADARPRAVYSAVALRACLLEGIERGFLHYDTTSVSLYGEYPDTHPADLQIVRGFSKDGHPELKQLVLGLLCNRQGVPVWADARDGNSEDTKANLDAIDKFCTALSPEQLRDTVYVADSKLVCGPNLQRMDALNLRFVSRLPESFAACTAAKEAALQGGQWIDLGTLAGKPRPHSARYRASEQSGVIDGHTYRLVVLHSDHLDARKRATFTQTLAKRREALHKELSTLATRRFCCAADAEQAAGALLLRTERDLFTLSLDIQPVTRQLPRDRRGRPRKDEPVREVTEFVVRGEIIEPDAARVQHEQELRGLFVLITNLDAQDDFPARRLLEEYRDQGAVEQRFAFLKDPAFIDGLFLHTPRRIEALSYVFVMACLLYSVFELRARCHLRDTKKQILLPGKRWSTKPTGKMLLALVNGLSVAGIGFGSWTLASPPHMTDRAREVANLIGYNLADILYSSQSSPPH
jgi:transposase